ncbi:hypothetical protein OE09_1433 [Flavobacteriaceae bacterium MAR_2010_72]|nr:hypothetical protein OE09_1433 [Flavobacteriaceae bacterium MAR_2010_72]
MIPNLKNINTSIPALFSNALPSFNRVLIIRPLNFVCVDLNYDLASKIQRFGK